MNPYALNDIEIVKFFACFVRVGGLFIMLPFFGDNTIPPVARVFLSFTISLVLFPIVSHSPGSAAFQIPINDLGIFLLVIKEALIGIGIGFLAKMFFDAIGFAFGFMGLQMGFNMASAFDHHLESQTPIITQLMLALATLLFLATNGHHLFLTVLSKSFELLPLGGGNISREFLLYVFDTTSKVFWIAVKLSAPMALTVFLINCAFGIVAKAVPQINVLVVSFTVNILAGFLVITLILPMLGTNLGEIFQDMIAHMYHAIRLLA